MRILDWSRLDPRDRAAALARPGKQDDGARRTRVAEILARVRREGDAALREFARLFDGGAPASLQVTPDELAAAEAALPEATRTALARAARAIERFHAAQRPRDSRVETWPGVECELRHLPLETVGLYIPAGSAPLVSTVLMTAIPARVAGCARRIICTPADARGRIAPEILAAARLCGVDEVYRAGGAQAIAALAWGTESVPRVDKIFGPGNAWVTEAKAQVARDPDAAAIDMQAGPSEVLVIADQSAEAAFIAADLLSQAEHGPDSQVLLVTDSARLARAVRAELERQLAELPRADIARRALDASRCLLVGDLDEAVAVSNRYAPEHLIIQTRDPEELLPDIRHAGSVFLGAWAPESLGDYCSGTNHVLPTGGAARHTGSLGLRDFYRTQSVQRVTRAGLAQAGETARRLAQLEGLAGHARAVTRRLEAGEENNVRRA